MRYRDPGSIFQTSSSPCCPLGSFPVTPDLGLPVAGDDGTQNRAIYREHQYSRGTDLSRAESAVWRAEPPYSSHGQFALISPWQAISAQFLGRRRT